MPSVTVLMVDDHTFFLRTLRRFLEEQHTLDLNILAEASDGVEACELSQSLHPQLVIMDVQMPRRDGIEACRMIKQERPETKVILYTIHDPELCRNDKVTQAEACMAKQDLFEELLSTMSRLMA
jgi:two-component system response regulator DegU